MFPCRSEWKQVVFPLVLAITMFKPELCRNWRLQTARRRLLELNMSEKMCKDNVTPSSLFEVRRETKRDEIMKSEERRAKRKSFALQRKYERKREEERRNGGKNSVRQIDRRARQQKRKDFHIQSPSKSSKPRATSRNECPQIQKHI